MAERVPTRLTREQGRRFGLTVGTAFLVVASIMWWRDHPNAMIAFGALGLGLALAGLTIPTFLGPVERTWMALALAISKVTTPIIMGAMYLVVFTPIGWLRRILGGNPLVHKTANDSYWHSRTAGARRSASMEHTF